jgi:hypothetical protein
MTAPSVPSWGSWNMWFESNPVGGPEMGVWGSGTESPSKPVSLPVTLLLLPRPEGHCLSQYSLSILDEQIGVGVFQCQPSFY